MSFADVWNGENSLNPERIGMLITCEHGGNEIPEEYRELFAGHGDLLNSHRGYDIGALPLARYLAQELGVPLLFSENSRLLVDLNRSLHHRNLFSELTSRLDEATRRTIMHSYYQPYRSEVEQWVRQSVDGGKRVIHLSIHSFTPVLNGQERRADIGLLYDPRRSWEKTMSSRMLEFLKDLSLPGFIYRRNYPYRGTADGMTSSLRRLWPDLRYAGIEIEVNQKLCSDNSSFQRNVCHPMITALQRILGEGR